MKLRCRGKEFSYSVITKATTKQMDLWTEQVTSQMNGQGKG